MNNTESYAKDIRSVLDFERYVSLIASIGNQLDTPKDRFDKSTIIEKSIEVYSNKRLEFVDGVGRDHYDTKLDLDLEFKFENNVMFSPKRKNPKKLVKVKLKNSLGSHKGTKIANPADYYMIGQQDAIAIISWNDIQPYLVAVPDGIETHIPFDKLSFVFLPHEVEANSKLDVNYKQIKAEAQLRLIESI